MEKMIKTNFDLATKILTNSKVEEVALWAVFLILPWVVLIYQAAKHLY